MKIRIYTFVIRDKNGLWGDAREPGRTEAYARRQLRRKLDRTELEPRGSLLKGYTLTRVPYASHNSSFDLLPHVSFLAQWSQEHGGSQMRYPPY